MAKLTRSTFVIEKDFGGEFGEMVVELKRHWTVADLESLDLAKLQEATGTDEDTDISDIVGSLDLDHVDLACRMIIDWNLEDEDGEDLPVEEEYIRQLPVDVFSWIMTSWNEEQERQKKD